MTASLNETSKFILGADYASLYLKNRPEIYIRTKEEYNIHMAEHLIT